MASKILTVFGATGNQGGSVIKAILADTVLSKEYKIRGVTRDTSKPSSKALEAQGVEMVSADMKSAETAAPAVQGAHTVFFVTNFWETFSADVELSQGKAVTDASKAAGVKHLIFSSLLNVTEISNGRFTHVTHFDGKAKIEDYIRSTGVPASFVLPGFFMSNLFDSLRKGEDGTYAYRLPVDGAKTRIPLFDASGDTGKFVKAALKHYAAQPAGARIYEAAEYITPNDIVKQFTEVTGKPAVFNQIPADVFKSFLPAAVAEELTENMLLLEDPGYFAGADISKSLALLDEEPTTWKKFVEANKARWA